MNYKQACLKKGTPIAHKCPEFVKKETDEQTKLIRSWERTVQTLSRRWEKYKEDYIALYGEDMYHYMYSTPNYWVMPEDVMEDATESGQDESEEEE